MKQNASPSEKNENEEVHSLQVELLNSFLKYAKRLTEIGALIDMEIPTTTATSRQQLVAYYDMYNKRIWEEAKRILKEKEIKTGLNQLNHQQWQAVQVIKTLWRFSKTLKSKIKKIQKLQAI